MAPARPKGWLSVGDKVGLTAEVTTVHDDGTVTIWLHGYAVLITLRAKHLSPIAKRQPTKPKRAGTSIP